MKREKSDIKEKTLKELEKDIQDLRNEIAKLTIESKVNAQKDTNMIYKKRKTLARLLTNYRYKQIQEKSK